jgi:hypothetical protein
MAFYAKIVDYGKMNRKADTGTTFSVFILDGYAYLTFYAIMSPASYYTSMSEKNGA